MNALRRIVRALRVSSRAVERDVGISGAQLFVLRQLADAPHRSLSDLVTRTLTHQSTVSEVVARLVDRGLVSRRAAADDARRAELALTARGRALLRGAPTTAQTSLVESFARLAPAQRRAIARGLEEWLAESGLAGVEPAMFFERSPARAASPRHGPKRQSRGGSTPAAKGGRTPTTAARRAAGRGGRQPAATQGRNAPG